MHYTTKQLYSAFSVSHQTIKNWASEFADYLSPTATPETNKRRVYTDEDVRVFDLVCRLKKEGKVYEEIRGALGAGQRGELPDMPHEIMPVSNGSAIALAHQRILQLQTEIEILKDERDKRIAAEGQVMLLERQLERTQDKLDETRKQVVQLEMKLEFRDKK